MNRKPPPSALPTIFAVTCNQLSSLRDTKFFASKKGARDELRNIAAARRHKMGVTVLEDTEDRFSFILGWEEANVVFVITEIAVSA